VTHKHTRYIVRRRGTAQAVVISFDDFLHLLRHEAEREHRATSGERRCRPMR
jgi:hypothetical protein